MNTYVFWFGWMTLANITWGRVPNWGDQRKSGDNPSIKNKPATSTCSRIWKIPNMTAKIFFILIID